MCGVAAHAPTLVGAPAPMSSVPTPGLLLGWKLRSVMESMFTLLLRTACKSTPVLTTYWSCVRITPTPCVPAFLQHRHHIRLALAPHRPTSATMCRPHTTAAVPNNSTHNLSFTTVKLVAGNLQPESGIFYPQTCMHQNAPARSPTTPVSPASCGNGAGLPGALLAQLNEPSYFISTLYSSILQSSSVMIYGQDTTDFSTSTCNAHEHGRLQRNLQRQRRAGKRHQRSRTW